MKYRLAGLLLLPLLAGCTHHSIAGTITSKWFEQAHEETYMMPMVVGKSTMFYPMTENIPDRYWLKVKSRNGNTDNVLVDKQEFARLHAGEFWKEESPND